MSKFLWIPAIILFISGIFIGLNYLPGRSDSPSDRTAKTFNKPVDQADSNDFEQVIRDFFTAVNEKRISDAFLLLDQDMISDVSRKESWEKYFSIPSTLEIKSITRSQIQDESPVTQDYIVIIETTVASETGNLWTNGDNIRSISVRTGKEGTKIYALTDEP